jgi:geranylgeranylglycerol-phosphate geranylgeranyltransferase
VSILLATCSAGAVTVHKVTSFTSKLISILRVTRILNSFVVFAATCVGGLLADGGQFHSVAAAGASMFFGAAFGYALNDYYDAPSDEINRPRRPIPSGALSRKSVVSVSLSCLFVSLLFTLALAPILRITVAGLGLLVWLYNVRGKRTGLPGNLLVSLLAGFTLIFGGLSAGGVKHTLFPALLAFLLHLPREVLKDVQDVAGDRCLDGRGIAVVRGPRFAARLSSVLLLGLVLLSVLPYATGYYGKYYAGIVLLLDAVLLWISVTLWNDVSEAKVRGSVRILKFAMLVGLVAVALGRVRVS